VYSWLKTTAPNQTLAEVRIADTCRI